MRVLANFLQVWKVSELRKKILFTAVILIIFRLAAHIPASGVDRQSLALFFAQSPFLTLLDIFSGGTLANFSILALGLNPYINASIIMQLMTLVSPTLEELSKEGEAGRAKINQYTRFLTVPLAAGQAVGMYFLLKSQGIISPYPTLLAFLVITMTAGTMFALWLGELITEHGIGNGVSFLIFAGIVGRLPVAAGHLFSSSATEDLFPIISFLGMSLVVIAAIVFMTEATRRIPVQYARRANQQVGLQQTYLPLRLNQAGVIPIIFAVSLVLLPSMLGQFLQQVPNERIAFMAETLASWFKPTSTIYNIVYFLLVVGFTYFYTAVIFNPKKIADEIKKYGGFIPGIRPGSPTATYLNFVLTRITLVGAIFLGSVAILPSLAQHLTGITALAIGGTGILIVVSVVLETAKKIEAQLVMRNYDKFLT